MNRIEFDARAFRVALAGSEFASPGALAKACRLSESYLRQVRAGRVPSAAVRAVLAAALAVDERILWSPAADAPAFKELT